MKFSALFFDFFGTLVDIFKVQAYFQNVREMAEILGANPEKFNSQWVQAAMQREGDFSAVRDRIADACKGLNAKCTEEMVKKAVEIRMNFFLTNTIPRPDTVPALEWAKSAGYPLGLITNCTIELPEIWHRHPLAKYFPNPIFSSVERVRKPKREIFLRACEKLHVNPAATAYIGDGDDHEMEGAAAVGMTPILVVDKDPNSFRRHPQPKMDNKVESLKDLPAMIEKLENLQSQ